MAVVRIPPDGAALRFKAQQENLNAEKQKLVEKVRDPKSKIKVMNAIKSLKEHDGWKIVEMWYTNKWSFRNIMNEFRGGKEEEYKNMMIQRETLEILEEQLNAWIRAGEKAQQDLTEEEKQSKH